MKRDQILEVCEMYDEILKNENYGIQHREKYVDDTSDMGHIRWMLNEIPKMVDIECKKEKVNRWIGFIQGVMWVKGYFTIEEMKGHNRSGKECPDATETTVIDTDVYPHESGITEIEK